MFLPHARIFPTIPVQWSRLARISIVLGVFDGLGLGLRLAPPLVPTPKSSETWPCGTRCGTRPFLKRDTLAIQGRHEDSNGQDANDERDKNTLDTTPRVLHLGGGGWIRWRDGQTNVLVQWGKIKLCELQNTFLSKLFAHLVINPRDRDTLAKRKSWKSKRTSMFRRRTTCRQPAAFAHTINKMWYYFSLLETKNQRSRSWLDDSARRGRVLVTGASKPPGLEAVFPLPSLVSLLVDSRQDPEHELHSPFDVSHHLTLWSSLWVLSNACEIKYWST